MRLAVRTRGIPNRHFGPLGQAWVAGEAATETLALAR
jgi:hypothetical protein